MTKEEIIFLHKNKKRGWAIGLVDFYKQDVIDRIHYDLIIRKIKTEFDIDISYNTLAKTINKLRNELEEKARLNVISINNTKPNTNAVTEILSPKKNIQVNEITQLGFVDGPSTGDSSETVFDL